MNEQMKQSDVFSCNKASNKEQFDIINQNVYDCIRYAFRCNCLQMISGHEKGNYGGTENKYIKFFQGREEKLRKLRYSKQLLPRSERKRAVESPCQTEEGRI